MKLNIAMLLALLIVGSTWVGEVDSKASSLSEIVFYVR